jgi:hypothetical protein
VWGRLFVAGLLLTGCSFRPGGGASDPPDSDRDGAGADAQPGVPDATPGPFDAAPPSFDATPPELLETLTVLATGEVETSDTVLESGATYILVAAGTVVVNDDGYSADSDYWWDDDLPGIGVDGFDGVDYGLAVNDTDVDNSRSPDWGGFDSSAHSYQITMAGTGATLTAQFHDRDYGNGNSGSLTLEIHGPPP